MFFPGMYYVCKLLSLVTIFWGAYRTFKVLKPRITDEEVDGHQQRPAGSAPRTPGRRRTLMPLFSEGVEGGDKMLKFWAVVSALSVYETWAEWAVSWVVPVYWELKACVLVALLLPQVDAPDFLFKHALDPFMKTVFERKLRSGSRLLLQGCRTGLPRTVAFLAPTLPPLELRAWNNLLLGQAQWLDAAISDREPPSPAAGEADEGANNDGRGAALQGQQQQQQQTPDSQQQQQLHSASDGALASPTVTTRRRRTTVSLEGIASAAAAATAAGLDAIFAPADAAPAVPRAGKGAGNAPAPGTPPRKQSSAAGAGSALDADDDDMQPPPLQYNDASGTATGMSVSTPAAALPLRASSSTSSISSVEAAERRRSVIGLGYDTIGAILGITSMSALSSVASTSALEPPVVSTPSAAGAAAGAAAWSDDAGGASDGALEASQPRSSQSFLAQRRAATARSLASDALSPTLSAGVGPRRR